MRKNILAGLSSIIIRWPKTIVLVALIITAFLALYSAKHIRLDSDLDRLVSEKLDYHRQYINFLNDFGDQEYLYLVVETNGNLKEAKEFTEHFAKTLKKEDGIKNVVYKIGNSELENNFLMFLPEDDLRNLSSLVGGNDASLKSVAEAGNAEGIFRIVAGELVNPNPEDEQKLRPLFSFFEELVTNLNDNLQGETSSFDLSRLFFGSSRYDDEGFLVSSNGKYLFCMIMPQKNFQTMEVIEKPLKNTRHTLNETRKLFPRINAGLTGKPVLSADEMKTTNSDMTRATILAIIAVAIVFMFFLRSVSSPLLAIISLTMGISWTYGFAALVFGKLNLLTVVFAIILVGAAIEYGIHVVARVRQERSEGKSPEEAVLNSISAVAGANIISALTTAAAFLALTVTYFTAIAQLGLISAVGVLLCLVSANVVLPAMLLIRERKRGSAKIRPPIRLSFLLFFFKKWKWVSLIGALLFVVCIIEGKSVGFNHNLLDLQADGLESVIYEHKLINETDESSWFAVSFANSIEESNKLADKFGRLLSVKRVEDITTIVPVDQEEKRKIIKDDLSPKINSINFKNKTPSNPLALKRTVKGIRLLLESLAEEAFSAGNAEAVSEIEKLTNQMQNLENNLSTNSSQQLNDWEKALFTKLEQGVEILKQSLSPSDISLDNLPTIMTQRYIGKSGRYAVYIYPQEDIWNPENLDNFVTDLREIDSNVTGTPIEILESSRLLERTFRNAAIIAALVVFLIASFYFKSFAYGGWSILPLVLGIGWLLGFMKLFGLHFNLANFFAIPIILGVGIDSAIHIAHRMKEEQSLESITKATGTAASLSALTSMIGFGMLIIAHHKGIRSLGEIMALGAFLCVLAAVVVLPPLIARFQLQKKNISVGENEDEI